MNWRFAVVVFIILFSGGIISGVWLGMRNKSAVIDYQGIRFTFIGVKLSEEGKKSLFVKALGTLEINSETEFRVEDKKGVIKKLIPKSVNVRYSKTPQPLAGGTDGNGNRNATFYLDGEGSTLDIVLSVSTQTSNEWPMLYSKALTAALCTTRFGLVEGNRYPCTREVFSQLTKGKFVLSQI